MFAVYVVHIKALKKGWNHGLVLKRVHRVIKFNEKAWLKPYIDMSTKFRKEEKKTNLKKIFWSQWMIQFLEKQCKKK